MNLEKIRKENGKSQRDIAKILDITQPSYLNYENGKTEPKLSTLIKLADYYNISLDYLAGRNFGNELGYLTKEQFENFKIIMKLNTINQYKVFGYATSLFENQ